jgi:C-terminal processing protease CtpA/Prc
VERSLIDHYAKNLRAAEDLAHVAWARDASDAIIGFRVVRVRCGSPLWEAGFENGDLITDINGHQVRTVPQALAAYVTLRVKRKLRVRGQRKDGTAFDHRYRLS